MSSPRGWTLRLKVQTPAPTPCEFTLAIEHRTADRPASAPNIPIVGVNIWDRLDAGAGGGKGSWRGGPRQ